LAGYVTTLDGELVGFVVIGNNSPASARVNDLIDRAVARLANFTRR
jgi:D-alanyl-D-alanine carboxypeptidase